MHRADRIRCHKCGTINNSKRTICRNCGNALKQKRNIFRDIFLVCISISVVMISSAMLLNSIGGLSNNLIQSELQSATYVTMDPLSTETHIQQYVSELTPTPMSISTPSPTKYYTNPFEFRNGVRFGMTMDEVKSVETAILTDESSDIALTYKVFIETNNDVLLYVFNESGLFCISYLFEGNTLADACIADYYRVNEGVQLEYGAPTVDTVIWLDDAYSGNPSAALNANSIIYKTQWDLPHVVILHGMMGGVNGITHTLTYFPTYGVDIASTNTYLNQIQQMQSVYYA